MVYNYVHSFDFPYQSIYISSSLIKAELLYYGTFENNSTAVSYCNSQPRVNPNPNPLILGALRHEIYWFFFGTIYRRELLSHYCLSLSFCFGLFFIWPWCNGYTDCYSMYVYIYSTTPRKCLYLYILRSIIIYFFKKYLNLSLQLQALKAVGGTLTIPESSETSCKTICCRC